MAEKERDGANFKFSYDVGMFLINSFDDGSATLELPDGTERFFLAERHAVEWANAEMLAAIEDGRHSEWLKAGRRISAQLANVDFS